MAKTSNIQVLLALLAITAAVVPSIEAADHVVGESSGWTVPPSPSFYSEWAAKQRFAIGDDLEFNFMGAHTVARTTKAGYESCDMNAATNTMSTSPAKVTLNTTGDYYFICTVPGHCAAGQKLFVTVGASSATPSEAPSAATPAPEAATTPEASSSSPSGSTIPTPGGSLSPSGSDNPMAEAPGSAASSLVATSSIVLISAAAALFL